MINPTSVTNFNRTDDELEEFMLFCIAVAGKRSDIAAEKINQLLTYLGSGSPFQRLREAGVEGSMRRVGLGPYNQRTIPTTLGVLDLDLRRCTLEELLRIPGMGPKTARMFLLHSRPSQEYVVLDTHLLRWLRESCRMRRVPRSTPGKLTKLYLELERKATRLIKKLYPSISFAEFDLNTWMIMSGRNNNL
jgi:thermostable 8-oxoguanine DNA glycosylase